MSMSNKFNFISYMHSADVPGDIPKMTDLVYCKMVTSVIRPI